MSSTGVVIATYQSHEGAEGAVKLLQQSGMDMKRISIVGKDFRTEEHVVGFYNDGDRMKYWGRQGAFWGGFWGLLFGSSFFIIPGFGHVIVLGPFLGMLVGALENAVVVGGLSVLGAALYGIGIPEDSVLAYEGEIRAGNFLLLVHGTPEELRSASNLLKPTESKDLASFGA